MAKTCYPMARPREFDIEKVLTTALDVFWAHGYDATSMSDLMEATGLAKGSLYKGYGDKKSLFMRALDSYLSSANAGLSEAAASSGSGREALEKIFSGVIGMSTCTGVRRGCFSVNSTIELAPHDADVRNRLRRNTRQKEKTIAAVVSRGIADGSLRKDLDPEVTASYVTSVMNGLQVRGKLGLTVQQANDTVAVAMAALV
jgi:TetR/AcrR family transcriptional repressor of nem operon